VEKTVRKIFPAFFIVTSISFLLQVGPQNAEAVEPFTMEELPSRMNVE
jgi:hypothetical protein